MRVSSTELFYRLCQFDIISAAYLKINDSLDAQFVDDLAANLQNKLIWGEYEHKASDTLDDLVVESILNEVISTSSACVFSFQAATSGPSDMTMIRMDTAHVCSAADHHAVKEGVRRGIDCQRTIDLVCEVVDAYACPGEIATCGLPHDRPASPLFADARLVDLDMFADRHLAGIGYARQGGNIAIAHCDPQRRFHAAQDIKSFVRGYMGLPAGALSILSPDCRIPPFSRPSDPLQEHPDSRHTTASCCAAG